jgi:hypothetical protein
LKQMDCYNALLLLEYQNLYHKWIVLLVEVD